LDAESRILLHAMFETVKRILELADAESQRCALHGLGHLDPSEVHDTVQHYIDQNKSDLPVILSGEVETNTQNLPQRGARLYCVRLSECGPDSQLPVIPFMTLAQKGAVKLRPFKQPQALLRSSAEALEYFSL
jgi:hypothetical protein